MSRIAAIRLTSSGALDATFATSGKYYYSNATPNGWANGITVDNNGRIYVGGAIGIDGSGTNRVVLLRLTSSGVADTTWNGGNEVSSQYINQFGGVGHRQRTCQILLQADGKILMTGYYHDGANEAMGLMDSGLNSYFIPDEVCGLIRLRNRRRGRRRDRYRSR